MNKKPKLKDYIQVYKNAISKDLCDLILNEYSSSDEWKSTTIGEDDVVNKDFRNCDAIGISREETININPDIRKKIDQLLFESISIVINEYVQMFPFCSFRNDSGYDLIRYEKGGYYREHTDSRGSEPRTLSLSLNLNGNYKGGKIAFFNENLILDTPERSIILFPSNFTYPHQILPVTKGTRYSIVTWFN